MEDTKIQWAHHTFNPWTGCSKVHAGCLNCYAETLMADRYKKVVWGPNGTRKLAAEATWRRPEKWNRAAEKSGERPRVFCASLADVFEEWDRPLLDAKGAERCTMDFARARLFALIDQSPNLDWLILTKRPENIRRMWPLPQNGRDPGDPLVARRDNVWLLTSASNQETYERQWPELAKCRDLSPVLGLSAEPLLGPIEIAAAVEVEDWVIAGGESGQDARPCAIEWVAQLHGQCGEAGIPFFAKQLGARPTITGRPFPRPLRDPKGGDWTEWAPSLRVRQFPQVSHG